MRGEERRGEESGNESGSGSGSGSDTAVQAREGKGEGCFSEVISQLAI